VSHDHTAQSGDGPGAKPVVLVVEDEVLVQMLVMEVLDDLGLEALEAGDGPSALAIVKSDPRIELMVTDVGLPGMNGRQLAEAVREVRPELSILFVTGYADKAAAGELDGRNMDMITKPFALEALSDKVTQMLGRAG
jgi:CheY-like chemotaxis protein